MLCCFRFNALWLAVFCYITPYFWWNVIFRCVRKIAKSDCYLHLICLSVCTPAHPSSWNILAPPEWIFMKFGIWVFFKDILRKLKFDYNLTRLMGTFHEDLCTFMISHWNSSYNEKFRTKVAEKIKSHFTFSNFYSENHAFYEIM